MTSLVDLDDDECRSLALVLRDVVRRYDALWGLPHAVRARGAPGARSATIRTTRSTSSCIRRCGHPGLLKYLAGPEIGGGSMTNESDPDEKAAELRAALT